MDSYYGNVRGVVGVWQLVGYLKKCRTVAGQVAMAMELKLLAFATIFENGNVKLGRNGGCVLVVDERECRVKKTRIVNSFKGGIGQRGGIVVVVDSVEFGDNNPLIEGYPSVRRNMVCSGGLVVEVQGIRNGECAWESGSWWIMEEGCVVEGASGGAGGGERVRTYLFESTGQNTERWGYGRIGREVIEKSGAEEEVLVWVVNLREELAVEEWVKGK
ncbi:uncharacterized protein MONOS_9757 [Monocercomonoides exilis]|uniref:uncharacterized protein n=1 Tax=Monocercomonoides exilis TaxID=2049356 RepID=UPI00355AB8C7|nr:hypothetical protein MONOS_9757 [Monocercomonoides exilis]|eukprot:MONOS_9757.1-p1 / transcript=MONOS_9757.1 / gene=MONOS_9757 / organism=Monocercomonoides_exilis_PA203 / gene_product=unspecified product / transcript_product=unspecified product / location=Mono_scaffold00415:37439-38089(-) / protein_length=217 / sequence_SO=supercontig / SO=protein_coding / is_pseudo=false